MSNTVKLAILDERLSAQIETRPEELGQLDVVWRGAALSALEREGPRLQPNVLVLDVALLGADPVATIERLRASCRAELALALYTFAKRDVVAALQSQSGLRPLQGPLTVDSLRAQLTGMVVSRILGEARGSERSTTSRVAPDAAARLLPAAPRGRSPLGRVVPRRYSDGQLGRLQEIKSTVECECPNHVADIMTRLVAFETYAATCESRNPADAAIHAMLHAQTAAARGIMEDALAKLIEHEGLAI